MKKIYDLILLYPDEFLEAVRKHFEVDNEITNIEKRLWLDEEPPEEGYDCIHFTLVDGGGEGSDWIEMGMNLESPFTIIKFHGYAFCAKFDCDWMD